jgi:maleate cis-trans isomerase
MSCYIYSDTNDLPIDFWNYINFSDNDNEFKLCSLDDINIGTTNQRVGNGFIINIYNKIYIITCFHIIGKNNMKNKMYFYDSHQNIHHQNIKIVNIIEEFDIAIMEPMNPQDIDQNIIFKNNDLLNKIYECPTTGIIKHMSSNISSLNNALINLISEETLCNINNIKNVDLLSSYLKIYSVPCLNITLNCEIEINKIHGLSGSIIIGENKILGMIILNENQNIYALPIPIIIELVKIAIKTKKNIEGIIINTQLCSFTMDKTIKHNNIIYKNDKLYNGHIVTDNFDISYQRNDKLTSFKFKSGKEMDDKDIILSVNNNLIDQDGNIYNEIIGHSIKLGLSLLLSFYNNNFASVEYLRNNKIDVVNIKGIEIDKHLSIHNKLNDKFIYYEGFVFAELSEDLIGYFYKKNIKIEGTFNFVNKKQFKYVVLVYINWNYLVKEYNKGLSEFRKYNFIDNKIFILEKIGNEVITGISSLNRIFSKKKLIKEKQNTFSYNIINNTSKNISVVTLESNNNIMNLKFID